MAIRYDNIKNIKRIIKVELSIIAPKELKVLCNILIGEEIILVTFSLSRL
jgi:hypothetical protein